MEVTTAYQSYPIYIEKVFCDVQNILLIDILCGSFHSSHNEMWLYNCFAYIHYNVYNMNA